MAEFDSMVQSLPAAYRKDPWVLALLDAVGQADEGQRQAARDTAAQLLLDSMTWLLDAAEQEAGVTPAPGAGVEERRSALAAKWRSAAGKCDIGLIQRVCDSWKNGEVAVQYGGSTVTLQFVGSLGVPDAAALDQLAAAVREVIPAHLALGWLFRYLLVREVSAMTVDGLQTHKISEFAFGRDGN